MATTLYSGFVPVCIQLLTGLKTVHGATLGVVGFGEVGREVARRARAFAMKVVYFQRTPLSAASEREFEAIRHDPAETELYDQFKARWESYRGIVNQMLALSRGNRKDDARKIYGSSSRAA